MKYNGNKRDLKQQAPAAESGKSIDETAKNETGSCRSRRRPGGGYY
ncbi:MAG: hypothetical protein K6E83_07830 [Clostridium sp.]|nr:hypothetical protein [Clostridium sp.]